MRSMVKIGLVYLILTGLLSLSCIGTFGIELEMDESLKDADASFIGEDADDYSGYSIAGAGDVNGDGYDDILISAYYDEEGGYRAGQVYLVLGKSSGFSMDTSLSDSDASFIGEDLYDRAGICVAGVGDVNGDGLDDFMIGAAHNKEGGDEAGQVYLIFGNRTGWAMDTDLSNADASFVGEAAEDMAGLSFAGDGDVNGDGLDDIVIGAPFNDEGGRGLGQTYLFFGKASGWSMDTSLSQADASFIGRDIDDYSGRSVDIVGDVNGDGLDDILIGADGGKDDRGVGTGAAYLVFGRTSGWSIDSSLSDSNASYYGQYAVDNTGYAVAGAGDVNDDGYCDVLIGAWARDSNALNSGEVYLVLGKAAGWKNNVSLLNADASFWGEALQDNTGRSCAGAGDVNRDGFDDFIIGADGNDEGASGAGQAYLVLGRSEGWDMNVSLDDVDASFQGENAYDWSGTSVDGAGDINGDGFDDILIGADGNDEGGDYAGQTYLVYGRATPPVIQKDSTYGIATTGDPFTFNVSVSSTYDISSANIEYWYGDTGPRSNGSANLVDGNTTRGTWHLDITIPSDSNETLHYVVHLTDGTFTSRSEILNVSVWDNDPPILGDDTTPTVATTGDQFTFTLNTTDNIELMDVRVEYWFGDNLTHTNDSMSNPLNDLWNLTILIPIDTIEELHYRFYAIDTSFNNETTEIENVSVEDNDPPVLQKDLTPDNATTGDPIAFSAMVSDNVMVRHVNVTYWFGDSGGKNNASMFEDANGTWTLSILVPVDSLDPIHYFFSTFDDASNERVSIERTIEVRDNDPPVLDADLTATNGTTGDGFMFMVLAIDNIGIVDVHIAYRYGEGDTSEVDLLENEPGKWEATIVLDDTLAELRYEVVALDAAGNVGSVYNLTVNIADDDLPELIEDTTPRTASTGDPFEFRIRCWDNVGIDDVTVTYAFGDSSPETVIMEPRGASGLFSSTVEVPIDTTVGLVYRYSITDLSGNTLDTNDELVGVEDNDHPEVIYDHAIDQAIKGLPLTFYVEAHDNIGVAEVFIVLRFGNNAEQNLSMVFNGNYSVDVEVPREPAGDLVVHFSARDEAGNWFSTDEYTVQLVNAAPELADIPTWHITESEETVLDLQAYVTDKNDDASNLTLECDDASFSVEGLSLKATFEEVRPDWTIGLIVSDGEDEVGTEVTVHIENVNDAPKIISVLPANGTVFSHGDRITFTAIASDEDLDELTFRWYRDSKELGTGSEFRYGHLPAGDHLITLRVSDGMETSEANLEITVSEESDDYSMVIAIVVVLAIVAVTIIYLRRRNDTA